MEPSGSHIKISISPDVPHDIIDETFEGALIRRMLGVARTKDGYELWSNSGVDVAAVNLDELVKLADESDSRYATAALPLVMKAHSENKPLFLDELGEVLGIEDFDITHVLQELCRMYPERLTHFAVAWAEITNEAIPDFGRLGGGADFVTADGIDSFNSKAWIEQKLQDFAASRTFVPGKQWRKLKGLEVWRAAAAHTDWRSVTRGQSSNFFEVEKIVRAEEEMELPVQYRISLTLSNDERFATTVKEAFDVADHWRRTAARESDRAVLASMGLSADEWAITKDEWVRVDRISPPGSEIYMTFDPDEGEWVLWDGDQLLGQEDEPQDLLAMLREAEAVFRS